MAEPGIHAPDPDFTALVRGALTHLYDHAYLQNHPLVSKLGLDVRLDHLTRAQELRRVLLECIEQLGAGVHEGSQPEDARACAVLTYRYVDGFSMEELGAELGLSQRSLYREHKKGLEAVACLVWDRVRSACEAPAAPAPQAGLEGRLEAVRAELVHLRTSARLQPIELQATLQSVVDMLAPLMEQRGVGITLSSPATWPALVADRVTLRQALVTLLSYALQFVQHDLVLRVGWDNGISLIEVREAGGEAATYMAGPPARTDGAALAIVQALIEAQGGHLETLDSGEGWRARIFLPGSGALTILVVEDNTDAVALFRRYLAGHKVTIVAARSGEQAMQLAAELQPQLIMLDVMMPDEDGWEILQRLKNGPETRHIPIVVCSVLNEPALALSMGASDYITKPVERLDLVDVLQRHLGPLPPPE